MLFKGFGKDNKGLSLVELLVAVAIAAIISGSIGYLLVYSLRMYKRETVNMSLQQELQTTLNIVMDSAMESQCLILNNSNEGKDTSTHERYGKTDSLVLGKFEKASVGKYKFTGMVFASSDDVYAGIYDPSSAPANGTLYMRRCIDEEFDGDDIEKAAISAIDGVKGESKYLLATSVENFYVYVDNVAPSSDFKPGVLVNSESAPAEKQGYSMWREVKDPVTGMYKNIFNNYLTLNINVSFAAPTSSRNDYKKVNDNALLRNFVQEGVYINGEEYLELSKARMIGKGLDDSELVAQTIEYPMEKKLVGYVKTGNGVANNYDFNVLEIVPDRRYSSIGYTIAGQEPVLGGGVQNISQNDRADMLDAMFCSFTGGENDGRYAYNLYYNTDDMRGICVVDARFDGYFEYVGPGNGYYAIDIDGIAGANTSTYTYKTVDDWNGGTKDIVTNVVMLSKASFKSNIDNSRFCWKWVEVDSYEETYAVTREQIEDAMNNQTMGFSIYLHDYRKSKAYNNEAFACSALRDVVEIYTTDDKGTLDINNGIYHFSDPDLNYSSMSAKDFRDMISRDYEEGGTVRTENYNAIKRWKDAGYSISVTSVMANEVTDAMVDRADLVVFAEKSDGAYIWALGQYGRLGEETYDYQTSSFGPDNDIKFSQLKKIYDRVAIKTDMSLAMPTAANGSSAPCIDLLFKMMYCTTNSTLSSEDIAAERRALAYSRKKDRLAKGYELYPDTYATKIPYTSENGTGREMYSDFFKSMSEDALSASFYDENQGYIKTTDYVYIDDDGNVRVEPVPSGSDMESALQIKNPWDYTYTDTYGRSSVPYVTWKNDIVGYLLLTRYQTNTHNMGFRYDYNNAGAGFAYSDWYDRESAKRTFATYTYVYEEGGHETSRVVSVKNGYVIGSIGGSVVYKNTLAYNNDSQLFKYQKDGSLGLLWIRSILDARGDDDTIGFIDVKGAGERKRELTDASRKYDESKVTYSYKAAPSANGKIISLSEYEYEEARDNGLDIFCLLSAKMDPLLPATQLATSIYNSKKEGVTYSGTNVSYGRYAKGVKSYENYPTEFVYHIPADFFKDYKVPMNDGNNEFVATMTVTVNNSGKKASGSDTFYIVVRDLFDLD